MPYTVTKYPQGTFSWADLMSTDVEKSKNFMKAIMGWTSKDMPTDQGPDYTMFYVDGHEVAGLGSLPEDVNVPSHWNSYVTVNDLDQVLEKVEGLGGRIVMPKMQVMNAGSMAGVQDPTGAVLMLWQPNEHIGATLVNTFGAMGWNELYTPNLEKTKVFYTNLLGWTFETNKEMSDYTIIKNNGRMNGGVVQITKEMEGMPPSWAVYFTVENLEKSLEKVKANGGEVVNKMDAEGVGKIAFIKSPVGAMFTLIQLDVKADEWME